MKYRLFKLILTSVFLIPFTIPLTAIAVENDTDSTQTTTNESEQKEVKPQTLQQRIEKHKTEFQSKLQNLNEENLKRRCKAAQGLVAQTNQRSGIKGAERTKRYDEIQKHLTEIVARLQAANIDTTTLEQQQAILAEKVAALKEGITNYQASLTDLKELDCEDDPTGFKASLEAARLVRDDLIKQIGEIKTYIKETIKPTLQQLKSQLEQQE